MKLKMLKTIHAAANEAGSISKDYEALKEYDVFEELANVFITNSWAIRIKENEVKEEKMVVEVVENKMIDNSPENKTKKTKKK